MAADLHIHVFEPPCTEADLADFFSNTMGSKWFAPRAGGRDWDDPDGSWAHVSHSPQIWVGEVSWLKASLLGDADTYIPDPVAAIHDLIGEDLPELTVELRDKILAALDLDNSTSYSIADKEPIGEFLDEHRGKRLFTVSW